MKITRQEFLRLAAAGWVVISGKHLLALLDAPDVAPPFRAAPAGLKPGATDQRSAEGTTSRPSKRCGMIIDTKKCLKDQGCTRCVEACDKAHNIPSFENPAHEIKWIWREPFRAVFSADQTPYMEQCLLDLPTLVMCNHCDHPPCVRVCPTGATWKREEDGVVMMDFHRCIGCRYCMAGCPYGSRSFNWEDPRPRIKSLNAGFPTRTKGVVEKCTFCAERLAKGQVPACVEACSEKSLIFGDLNNPQSEVRQVLASRYLLRRRPELGTGPNVYYLL
jgi:molybdopterin-containing oxidoreductase family iron-sulfur binding subunit